MARVIVILAALAAVFTGATSPALGAGSPDINVSVSSDNRTLYGQPAGVTLSASNPAGQPYGYNLSFRAVLPPGISYGGGSSVTPTQIADAPSAGETTLIFENVSDLSPGSSFSLSFLAVHDSTFYEVGAGTPAPEAAPGNPWGEFTIDGGGYINSDPRFVPDFDAQGQPIGPQADSFTGFDTGSTTTEIAAFIVEKSEPSTEGEILRGVHDHQTVYTLRVRNNSVNDTDDFSFTDYLPAGLEFLTCGAIDNTTDAPTNPGNREEYANAPLLSAVAAPGTVNCVVPDVVDTETVDPDGAGPLASGVYTRVEWNNLTDLIPGQIYEIQYVAGVPIRENTETWSGGSEPATTGVQSSNLDNNSGAETSDEQGLTNYAVGTGTYNLTAGGTALTTDDQSLTRTAEDVSVHKSVSDGAINQGDVDTWDLLVETSEYRVARNFRLEDTVPDGLCPLGENTNHESDTTAECDGAAGDGPTITPGGPQAPYTSITENADGTWTIIWDDSTVSELDSMGPSTSLTVSFKTRTRAFYQENGADDTPVFANDSWTNQIGLEAVDYIREEGGADISADEPDLGNPNDPGAPDFGDPDWNTYRDVDSSSASQQAGSPSLSKQIATPASPYVCDIATASYVDGPAISFGPGDEVCWKLRVDFQAALDTGDVEIKDFLPPSSEYVAGSMAYTTNDNLTGTVFDDSEAANGVLTWTPGDVDVAGVFEATFRTRVAEADQFGSYDLSENLMKMSYLNTPGSSFPLRDEADFEWTEAEIDVTKGVLDINGAPGGGNPADTDGLTVQGGDTVTYRIDLLNAGSRQANRVEVWDRLPDAFDCSDVPGGAISDGGTCVADPIGDGGNYITWDAADAISVAAETNGAPPPVPSTYTLTYDVVIPSDVAPNTTFNNIADIRSYQSDTNTAAGTFTYYPENNVDPGLAASENTTEADDPSDVSTGTLAVTKSRTTEVTEAGNTAAQATIGEEIDYTVSFTVPEGTTIYGSPTLTDFLTATRQTFVSGSANATFNGGALPPGVTLDSDANMVAGNAVTLFFGATYQNAANSGDDTFVITFTAQAADTGENHRLNLAGGPTESSIPNQATLSYEDAATTAVTVDSNTTTTRVVEPNITLVTTENDADDVVQPFDQVVYTLAVTNTNGTRVSTAHDFDVTDIIPPGMTVVNAGTGTVNPGAGPSGEDTITWTISSLAPGATTNLQYTVEVDPGTVASSYTNTSDAVTTSLPDPEDNEGERNATSAAAASLPGYAATDSTTLSIGEPALTKAVSAGSATIGEDVTYTLTATIPAGLSIPDATVIDTIPDGLTFDGFATATASCTSGCPPDITPITNLGPEAAGADTRVGWFLGDIDGSAAASDRVVTITYRARPTDAAGNEVPASYDNSAALHWNPGNDIAGTPANPDPALFNESTTPDVETVTLAEPLIVQDLSETTTPANDGTADAGDIEVGTTGLTYTIVVENTGTADAHDVRVTSLPGIELENVVWTPQAGITQTSAWANPGDGQEWVIAGPIAPGLANAVTITFTADLRPSGDLTPGVAEPTATPNDTVITTSDVAAYYGVPQTTHDADPTRYREYGGTFGAVADDTVTLTAHTPDVSITNTTGAAGFPESADAELLQPFDWRIVVTNNDTVATATGIDIADVLPANWDYVANSAQFVHSGTGAVGQIEPAITPDAGGDTLTWTDIDSPATELGPGETLTLTFQATPQLDARDTPGLASPHVANASATAEDTSGASGTAAGAYAAGPDPAQATLQVPVLTLTKTPDGDPVSAGAPGQYQVQIANTGAASARNVTITDLLPGDEPGTSPNIEGVTYTPGDATAAPAAGFSEDASGYDPAATTSPVVWTITEVPAAGSVTITIPVTTNTPQPNSATLTNQADVTADEFRPADITPQMSDTGSLVIGSAPNFAVDSTKTATPADSGDPLNPTLVAPTDRIDYAIHVENDGNANATGVVVTDTIPTNTTYVAGSATAGPPGLVEAIEFQVGGSWQAAEPADPGLVEAVRWLVGDLNAPPEVTELEGDLAFAVTVDRPLVNGTPIANSASIVSDQTPGGTTLGPVNHEVTSAPILALEIVADDDNLVVNDEGDLITYTLTVTNTGDENATNTVITAGPPDGTIPVSVDAGNGVVECSIDPAPGPYTFGACGFDLSGVTQFRWTFPTVVVDVPENVGFVVRVPRPFPNGTVLDTVGAVESNETASVDSNTEQVTVTTAPRLELTKTANPGGTVVPGQEITYTLAYRNTGSADAANVVVSDDVPARTAYVAGSATAGANLSGRTLTWPIGALAVDASGSVSFRVTVDGVVPVGSTIENAASVVADGLTPVSAEADNPVSSAPTVTLTKRAVTKKAVVGKNLVYEITAEIGGNAPAANLTIRDELPSGLRFVSATDGGTHSGGVVTWNLGTRNPGETIELGLTTRPKVGNRPILNTVSAEAIGVAGVVSAPARVVAKPDRTRLVARKKGPKRVIAGRRVVWTVMVKNQGPAKAERVRVFERLPRGFVIHAIQVKQVKGKKVRWKRVPIRRTGSGFVVNLGNLGVKSRRYLRYQTTPVVGTFGPRTNNIVVRGKNLRKPARAKARTYVRPLGIVTLPAVTG